LNLNDAQTWSLLAGEDGSEFLGRAGMLPTELNPAVEIELDDSGTWLLWKARDRTLTPEAIEVKHEGLLDRFKNITTPIDVLKFAQRNGPLQICHHGLTSFHNRPPGPDIFSFEDRGFAVERNLSTAFLEAYLIKQDQPYKLPKPISIRSNPDSYCLPLIWDSAGSPPVAVANQVISSDDFGTSQLQIGAPYAEPLAIWFAIIERTRSLLRVIANHRLDQPGRGEDWSYIAPEYTSVVRDMDDERLWVSALINQWLNIGGVRPQIDKRSEDEISLNWSTSLFGALGIQLLGVFRGAGTLAICVECQDVYTPLRVPKTNHPNYCKKKMCQSAASRNRKRKAARNNNGNV
jgi:hypothetical protein